MKRTFVATLAFIGMLAWVFPATAQQGGGKKMYRCGTHFQDQPCDGSAAGSKAGSNAAGNTAGAASPKAGAPAATTAAVPTAKPAGPVARSAGPVVMVPPPQTTKLSAAEARTAQQKQIRCENFGRQASELRDRQKSTPQYAASIAVQLKSLEGRMSADGC